ALRYQTAQELERALMEHVFTQAKGLEDTDVSGFLRQLFGTSRDVKTSAGSSAATGTELASRSMWVEQKTQTTGLRARRADRNRRRLWRWVFLTGVALLLISTSALVLHLQPRGKSAIGVATASAPQAPQLSTELLAQPSQALQPEAPIEPTREISAPPTSRSLRLPKLLALRRERGQARPPPSGTLVLQVSPWAQVYIDGKNQGEITGVRRFRLRSGKHRLEFKHPRAVEARTISATGKQEVHQAYQVFAP